MSQSPTVYDDFHHDPRIMLIILMLHPCEAIREGDNIIFTLPDWSPLEVNAFTQFFNDYNLWFTLEDSNTKLTMTWETYYDIIRDKSLMFPHL